MFATSRMRITGVVLACAVLTTGCGQSTSNVASGESAESTDASEETTPVSDPESTVPNTNQDKSPEDASSDDQQSNTTTTSEPLFTTTTSGKQTASSVESTTTTPGEDTSSTKATTTSAETSTSISSTTAAPAQPGDSGADDADYDPGLKPLVDQARADLASRLKLDETQIALTLAEIRAWPNSANGCPIDGLNYLQVVTDGAELKFSANGATYRYTTGGQIFTPKLCEN